jgi:hypothetical protein
MKLNEPIIICCEISPYPRPMPEGMFDPMPKVNVRLSDGKEKVLFEFYPDEISFVESEFIGLTEESAHRLRFEKDKRYIQSGGN